MRRIANKKYYLTRDAQIATLLSQGYPILDYDDPDWANPDIVDCYHRCPSPWSKYGVSPGGEFIDLHDGRTFAPLAGGEKQKYPNVSVACDNKDSTQTVVAHRILAATFLPNTTGYSFEECHVDHRNCDKSNYHLYNLDIVTPARNKALAYIKNERFDNHNVLVRNLDTGEEIYCYSQAEAARTVGTDNPYLTVLFRKSDIVRYKQYEITRITREQYSNGRLTSNG